MPVSPCSTMTTTVASTSFSLTVRRSPTRCPKGQFRTRLGHNTGIGLFHQKPDGTFEEVTAKAGLQGEGYGMGVAVGDYDNDGYEDLYVTAYGGNRLYHNNGNGTFTDVTDQAGVGVGGWSTSAAWIDLDRDGLLDLVVLRYLEWDFDDVWCASTRKATGPIAIRIISNRLRRLFITTRATDTLPRCPRKSDWPSRAKGWASRTVGCTGWTRRKRPCADIRRNRIQRAPRRHPLRRIPQPTLSELLGLGSCVRGATLNFFDAIEFFFGPIERMNLLV